jgi:hypothetical protein
MRPAGVAAVIVGQLPVRWQLTRGAHRPFALLFVPDILQSVTA